MLIMGLLLLVLGKVVKMCSIIRSNWSGSSINISSRVSTINGCMTVSTVSSSKSSVMKEKVK